MLGNGIYQRVVWQDTAKGLGIALVVMGHVVLGLMNGGLVSGDAWNDFYFALYTFHMPLFMFLAGLNVPRSLRKSRNAFVRSKVLTVAYPYFAWSIIHGSIMVLLASYTNGPIGWGVVAKILWLPIDPFWFLYVLFVVMVMARYLPLSVLLVISVTSFLFGELLPWTSFLFKLLHFPLFFCLGMIVATRALSLAISSSAAVLAFCVAALSVTSALHLGFANYGSILMLPAAVGGGIAMLWVAQKLEGLDWLALLGRLSMPIYVMHILAAAGTRIVLYKILHIPANPLVYVLAGTVVGIVAPIAAYYIFRYFRLLPWLGLDVGPKGRRWINGDNPGNPNIDASASASAHLGAVEVSTQVPALDEPR